MKRIFRRKSRSNSASHGDVKPFQRRLSLPAPNEVEILHSINSANVSEVTPPPQDSSELRSLLDEESVALSETETLAQPKSHRWDLQETYTENYTEYLPYVINRLRAERQEELRIGAPERNGVSIEDGTSDDDETVISELGSGECILRRPTTVWNLKRSLIVGREFIKGTTYVFPDASSFEKFRYLRSNMKKLSKNSFIIYDAEGNIKKVKGKPPSEENAGPLLEKGCVVDQRQQYHSRGLQIAWRRLAHPQDRQSLHVFIQEKSSLHGLSKISPGAATT